MKESTHNSGHTLDLVITRKSENTFVSALKVDMKISDHNAVPTLYLNQDDHIMPSASGRPVAGVSTYPKNSGVDQEGGKSTSVCPSSPPGCTPAQRRQSQVHVQAPIRRSPQTLPLP